MWKDDNDNIAKIFEDYLEGELNKFPVKCPVCGSKEGHIYMHRWKKKEKRGGVWTWCSKCKYFFHGTITIPEEWINMDGIEFEQLAAIPEYLEKNKDRIDNYLESLKDC